MKDSVNMGKGTRALYVSGANPNSQKLWEQEVQITDSLKKPFITFEF